MNVPSVLRPPSNDTMAGVIPTHEPPSLPLEMGQNVNQNIIMGAIFLMGGFWYYAGETFNMGGE